MSVSCPSRGQGVDAVTAVPLSQGFQPPDAPSSRDHLDIGDIADDFKHCYRSLKPPTFCSASVKGTEAFVNEDDDFLG